MGHLFPVLLFIVLGVYRKQSGHFAQFGLIFVYLGSVLDCITLIKSLLLLAVTNDTS